MNNNSPSLLKNRVTYVRITSLTMDELPIERVEGRITSGSVSIDGTSAVRRTCSLSMVSDGKNLNEYNWTLKTKFTLEVGIEDTRGTIKWYKQGTYVLTSFSVSWSTNNCTISLQGKDKMCNLNGEMGGALAAEVDFGTFQEVDADGNIRKIQRTLKEIITDAVHYYGGEPLHNIIINDLDDRGLELQEYRCSTPLYLIRKSTDTNYYLQGTLNGSLEIEVNGQKIKLSELDQYDSLVGTDFIGSNITPTIFTIGGESYCAAKIEYGQTAGYTATEMVYNDELIGGISESVTSILDKIKSLLGNFEYFYDVDGRFIFQEQKNYINTSWSPLQETDEGFLYVDSTAEKVQAEFTDTSYFTAFNISPNITNVKNDFSIWGTRKGISGADIRIHMRYAIDTKPVAYRTICVEEDDAELKKYNEKYNLNTKPQTSKLYITELIQDMVYYENSSHTLFLPNLEKHFVEGVALTSNESNDSVGLKGAFYKIAAEATEIEKYCDWREVIYQMAKDYQKYGHLDSFPLRVAQANPELFPAGTTGYEQYYIDLYSFWRQLYCYLPDERVQGIEYYNSDEPHASWNKAVYTEPQSLNFWFDFLDLHGEMEELSVRSIGRRPKAVEDKDAQAIYYQETPEIIFTDSTHNENNSTDITYTGYSRLNVGMAFKHFFTPSMQGKSIKDALDTLLYNHTYCTENLSITTVPIYELEPNKRIYVRDENAGIDGEYIVSKLTVPLQYNGTMSITASKAIDRIF